MLPIMQTHRKFCWGVAGGNGLYKGTNPANTSRLEGGILSTLNRGSLKETREYVFPIEISCILTRSVSGVAINGFKDFCVF